MEILQSLQDMREVDMHGERSLDEGKPGHFSFPARAGSRGVDQGTSYTVRRLTHSVGIRIVARSGGRLAQR